MTATTPFLTNEDMLGPLASRYVDVDSLPWKPTPCPGIDMKILLEDKESGLLTALFRWQAGAGLGLHEEAESTAANLSGAPRATATSRARRMARWCCRCFSSPTSSSTARRRGSSCGSFLCRPGESRDPLVRRSCRMAVDTGFRRYDR